MELNPLARTASQVRAVLEDAGYTQTAVAEVLGITQSGVSKRYRGVRPWRAHELELLSRTYDIPVERFYSQPAGQAS